MEDSTQPHAPLLHEYGPVGFAPLQGELGQLYVFVCVPGPQLWLHAPVLASAHVQGELLHPTFPLGLLPLQGELGQE